jgi:hypothetical protein
MSADEKRGERNQDDEKNVSVSVTDSHTSAFSVPLDANVSTNASSVCDPLYNL